MALNDAILNIGAAAMQAAMTHMGLHTAAPNTSGSNPALSARQAITWETAANGDMIATVDLPFTGGAASGPVTHAGFWSSAGTGSPPTGGTFYGAYPVTGDATFNADGEYTVTSITLTGSAT
jgi:hypothetical protein